MVPIFECRQWPVSVLVWWQRCVVYYWSVWDEEGGWFWRTVNGDQVHSKDASACLTQKTDVEHKRWRINCRNTERKDRLETYEMTQILMFGAEEVKLHKTDYSIITYVCSCIIQVTYTMHHSFTADILYVAAVCYGWTTKSKGLIDTCYYYYTVHI